MAIPFLSDIWDIIKSFFSWVWDTFPKPILFLIFILITIILGSLVLPFIFQMSGFHCAGEEKVYQINVFSRPSDNIEAWLNTPDKLDNSTYYNISDYSNHKSIFSQRDFDTNCLLYDINNFTHFNSKCVLCENNEKENYESDSGIFSRGCKTNAYYLNISVWQKLTAYFGCDFFNACKMPFGWYYDFNQQGIFCINQNVCGENYSTNIYASNLGRYEIRLIQDWGGVARLSKPENESYGNEDFVKIKCSEKSGKYLPILAIANIDIFNPYIWLILIIIIMLMWGIDHFRQK